MIQNCPKKWLSIRPRCLPSVNRRMPNCTTVVQTAGDLFDPEIQLNSPKK